MKKVGNVHIKLSYRKTILNSIPKGRWSSNVDNQTWKTLICVDDGRIVGTSIFCKSRFEQLHDWGEVISIYLLPDYMGKGYGKMLMKSAISELKMQGCGKIFLWVLEENVRARLFYEKISFLSTDDFFDDTIGGKELREIRYVYK